MLHINTRVLLLGNHINIFYTFVNDFVQELLLLEVQGIHLFCPSDFHVIGYCIHLLTEQKYSYKRYLQVCAYGHYTTSINDGSLILFVDINIQSFK